MELSITCTPVFARLTKAVDSGRYNVYVFEGGSRSSKTHSIIQYFILYALKAKSAQRVVIARKKKTWLIATVWEDFKRIVLDMGLSSMVRVNNSSYFIVIGSVTFEFVGLDDTQRLHGLTSDVFWINEAMEAAKDDFDNLEQRCRSYAIIDYNPTSEEHWIYDKVCPRDDCYFDHSTMLDNPFIPANMKRKILSYEPTEYNYAQGTVDIRKWKIYGLGERAKIEGLIYSGYEMVDEIPVWVKQRWRGIDWGFSLDPTAIVTVGYHKGAIYIDEECYQTGMLNSDIINVLKRLPRLKIWADNAEPKTIKEISNAGFFIQGAKKGAGSVLDGIQFIQGLKIYLTTRSLNVKKELDGYTWQQDREGNWKQIPVDDFNHALDSVRYICTMELMGKRNKEYRDKVDIHKAFAH